MIEHHIACLKIAIQETFRLLCRQIFGKHTKIGLQHQLVEIDSCRFQKAILEVVQVKQHAFYIEFGLWITLLKVESNGSPHLHFG